MTGTRNRTVQSVAALLLMAAGLSIAGCHGHARTVDLGYKLKGAELSKRDVRKVLRQGVRKAKNQKSLVRINEEGEKAHTRMHIFVMAPDGEVLGRRSMPDAWPGSVDIARAKAFTATAFSSDQNALTSRSIGALSQPGGPLWQIGNSNRKQGIIEFPGGVPLYKDGQLVGAVGVSGDGVEQDENVAQAASKGYRPPKRIRIDQVTGGDVPYTK